MGEGSVGAAPAPLVDHLQAQVGKRWDSRRAQQRISQLQQGVATAGEQACSSARKVRSSQKGEVGSAMTAEPDRTQHHRQPDWHKHPRRVESQAKSLIFLQEAGSGLKSGWLPAHVVALWLVRPELLKSTKVAGYLSRA